MGALKYIVHYYFNLNTPETDPKHFIPPEIPGEQYGIYGLGIIYNMLQCITFKN